MRLLVIEDDFTLRETLADLLRDEGHEVALAGDGASALGLLETATPEAILLDLMMPGLDGKHFRIAQLSDARFASIPPIVITAAQVDDSNRIALGEAPVLRKPFSLADLLAGLDAVAHPRAQRKECACGRIYDPDAWLALPLLGVMDNGRGVGEQFELRRCHCGTTLCWQIGEHAISVEIYVAKPPKRS